MAYIICPRAFASRKAWGCVLQLFHSNGADGRKIQFSRDTRNPIVAGGAIIHHTRSHGAVDLRWSPEFHRVRLILEIVSCTRSRKQRKISCKVHTPSKRILYNILNVEMSEWPWNWGSFKVFSDNIYAFKFSRKSRRSVAKPKGLGLEPPLDVVNDL